MKVELGGLTARVIGPPENLRGAIVEVLAANGASVGEDGDLAGRSDILVHLGGEPETALRLIRAASQVMIANGSGRIVIVASTEGLVGLRGRVAEAAANAGLISLARGLAVELAPHNVLVNAVAAGPDAASTLSHNPLGRTAEPREIAQAVLFLVAPESSYVTGHVLVVDGGFTVGFARDF